MTKIFLGKEVAASLNEDLLARSAALADRGVNPTLAILRIGGKGPDLAYERGARKRAEKTGVRVVRMVFPEDITQESLITEIQDLNEDPGIHGILIFRPLPVGIDDRAVRAAIAPEKDVDGITDTSCAGVYTGSGEGFVPCTAEACIDILDHYGVEIAGKTATVVGRSPVIGRPAALLLMGRNATVTVCHTKTPNLAECVRRADIVIAAAGRAGLVGADCLRPGQTVIDVAVNVGPDGSLRGDVDFKAADGLVSAITPVPGGVGRVTTSVLMKHVVEAAERSVKSS